MERVPEELRPTDPAAARWGAGDDLLPRGHQETPASRIKDSVLTVYPDAAHGVLWEVPERVAGDAAAFIRSHADAPDDGRAPGTRSLASRVRAAYENLPLPAPVVAAIGLDLVLSRLRPFPLPGPRALHQAAGCTLVLAGVGLNLWALAERRRRTAGTFALEQPEGLVSTGPYAFSRHPMYVGWWLIELGAGTLARSSWVLVTMPAELLVEHRFVVGEEDVLAGLFGDSYRAYANRVPRYLGMPRSWDAGRRD